MAAPYKLHGGNSTTRSLRAWNECTKREYAKEGRTGAAEQVRELVQRVARQVRLLAVVVVPVMRT